MNASEKIARIRLYRSQNIGPVTFRTLTGRFGSALEALAQLPTLAQKGGRKGPLKICSEAEAEKELTLVEKKGGQTIFTEDACFPPLLPHIVDPPPFLHLLGLPELLPAKALAVVGTRNASITGVKMARKIASDLADERYLVVSGLARGIDRAAHQGALEKGTVAILGCGIDIVYPKENQDIYDEIKERGVILSEFPPGERPAPKNFPRRNRLISGMSLGVVVIEANKSSGSLITARYAADQSREIFAVPGSPSDPRAGGPNSLLRDGAHLVTHAGDIIAALKMGPGLREPEFSFPPPESQPVPDEQTLDQHREKLLDYISFAPVSADTLISETGWRPALIAALLVELELAGRIERLPGNVVMRRPEENPEENPEEDSEENAEEKSEEEILPS